MAVSAFSPLTPRFCPWCQTPFQGRSDKKFCSNICRSQVQRHGVPAPPIDWPAQLAAAEARAHELQGQLDQYAQAQQAARPSEAAYDNIVRLVGLLAQTLEDEQKLADYLGFFSQQLGTYAQHPGLATQEPLAQQRLLILQQVQDLLVDRQRNVAELREHKRRWQLAVALPLAASGPEVAAEQGSLPPAPESLSASEAP